MKFLDNIESKTLVIVQEQLKNKVLEYLNNLDKLVNVKIMTVKEFFKHYFFDYNEETIYYLMKKYHISYKNAKIYLQNMKYVIDINSRKEEVLFLQDMYNDLKNNHLLIMDNLFLNYLKQIQIKVLVTEKLEPFFLKILDNYNVSYEEIEKREIKKSPCIYHFKDIKDECAFIFNEISSLIKKGVPRDKIKLMNVTNEYYPFLKRMAKFYHLKINNLNKYSVYGTITISKLLKMIEDGKSRDDILKVINNNLDNELYTSFFNVVNRYYFVPELKDALNLIKEDLKNLYLKEKKYQFAIEILPLNSYLIDDDDYVFVLGFNLENIPKTYKDIDYLKDNLKKEIGLFTSTDCNVLEKDQVLFHLKNIPNLVITYKDNDPYQSYYPSNLLEDLGDVLEGDTTYNTSSNIYNKILLTTKLDNYLKYGEKATDLSFLLSNYPDIPYMTYDNQFKGIKENFSNLILSYTSLNNYYHCAFRYYVENILKLNIYEDTFLIYIGNLFHFVLSKMFTDDFSLENTYQEFIKDKEFSCKEKFYLETLKEELKEIVKIIKYQHSLSGLNKVALEQEIKLTYDNSFIFKGIIDKIMYLEKNGCTYLSLIDYKTGTPKIDMSNMYYGIDMQLPIYVYLVMKSNLFSNPEIIGFYFQKIIHEKPSYTKDKSLEDIKIDKMKLNGYTVNDDFLVSLFDESYENSNMIKGMKITSKGFSHYTKVLSKKAISNLVLSVDEKIKKAFEDISNADFSINPKVIGGENIGCQFCPYQDLCFKSGKNLDYREKQTDLTYLEVEGGEEDA